MITKIKFTVGPTQIDQMGIVHHSYYPIWFETARQDYFKKAGITNSKIAAQGFFLPLSKMECEFKSPATYKNEIIITTKIVYMSCVKVKFEYSVINGLNEKLLAIGRTVHAWTDRLVEPLNIEKAAPEIYKSIKRFAETPGIS